MNKRAFRPVMGVCSGARLHLESKHPEFICSVDPVVNVRQGDVDREFIWSKSLTASREESEPPAVAQ